MSRVFIAIDLKSFYASVECMERGLDPMTTNLVVADASRTEKTICLAVTPSLKAYGISGRARLFEVIQAVKEINAHRQRKAPGRKFTGSSYCADELEASPELSLDYITATPQMSHYLARSADIHKVYLKYIAPEDIHVYSIDEVFMDVTSYLNCYRMTARELARTMILDVLHTTGITATAGLGTNLYLAKVAMDIGAKHSKPDADGVRIAALDEMAYRRLLWTHRPLTDFWRVGPGYAKKLENHGLYTMGDIARCSLHDENLLYKLFGINAELLIDHAWGREPCSLEDVKSYKPASNSLGSGQVLQQPYSCEKAKLIAKEMIDLLVLDLVEKGLVTDQIVMTIGYDMENLKDPKQRRKYRGEITVDHYGRYIPKHAHGTANLGRHTSSTKIIMDAAMDLFDRIADENLLIRRVNVTANHGIDESTVPDEVQEQLDLFTNYEEVQKKQAEEATELARERNRQKAVIKITKKYGKNAILKGMNFEDGAMTRNRNQQIGGHRA